PASIASTLMGTSVAGGGRGGAHRGKGAPTRRGGGTGGGGGAGLYAATWPSAGEGTFSPDGAFGGVVRRRRRARRAPPPPPPVADTQPLDGPAVRGILPRGGTVLGSSRTNPLSDQATLDGKTGMDRIKENLAALGVDAMIAIGGEDTLGVAGKLYEHGVNVVG